MLRMQSSYRSAFIHLVPAPDFRWGACTPMNMGGVSALNRHNPLAAGRESENDDNRK
jgi:hypothetical protein